jgi:MFS family permease
LQEELRAHVRHNFRVNVTDALFFGLGLGFASTVTVIPLFLNTLTTSTILIGLMASLHSIGWQIPQLFTANHVARLPRYKPMVLRMTLHERWPFFALAVVALLIPTIGNDVSVLLALLFLVIHSLGGGLVGTAWQSMIGKIMPSDMRGTFFGVQSAAANLLASGGALLAGVILDKLPSPQDFALCFLLAGLTMTVSFMFLRLTREPEHEPMAEKTEPLGWNRFLEILRRDGNFRWFLLARLLAQIAWMALSFYTIYAVRNFKMDEVTAGVLTFILMISQTAANPILGWLGDRYSHRLVYALGALLITISAGLALAAPDLSWFYLVFGLAGASNATLWVTTMSLTMEFGKEGESPLYIGLANTLIAPLALFAPILGGWLADKGGFQATFIISAAAGLAMAFVLLFTVRSPRRLKEAAPAPAPSPALGFSGE